MSRFYLDLASQSVHLYDMMLYDILYAYVSYDTLWYVYVSYDNLHIGYGTIDYSDERESRSKVNSSSMV